MRTIANYELNVEQNDRKSTGIVENCRFHGIPGFHMTKNLLVGVMHDILKRIRQYDLGPIFLKFIKIDKIILLIEGNYRIRGFNYGSSKNTPTDACIFILYRLYFI